MVGSSFFVSSSSIFFVGLVFLFVSVYFGVLIIPFVFLFARVNLSMLPFGR